MKHTWDVLVEGPDGDWQRTYRVTADSHERAVQLARARAWGDTSFSLWPSRCTYRPVRRRWWQPELGP